ncbi:MAG: TRAP transporter small permease [Desulfohalobiaceae bacterium]|nr:TRAP transporter small permease [Desulfohalobiaceae bacterium]
MVFVPRRTDRIFSRVEASDLVMRPTPFKAMDTISFHLAKIAAYFSALILVYMVGHIILEITLRAFFSTSTNVLDEFVAYATVSITFLCLAYTLHQGSLIRVGLVLNWLTGKWRCAFEIFAAVTTLGLTGFVIYYFFTKTLWRDFSRGTVSPSIAEVPLWIPESLVFLGLLLFFLQLLTALGKLVFELFSPSEYARTNG